MDVYEVVTKLIGPIDPVGESHTDNSRLDNLKQLIDLTEQLVHDLTRVVPNKERPEYSMSRAGEVADNFLKELLEELVESQS